MQFKVDHCLQCHLLLHPIDHFVNESFEHCAQLYLVHVHNNLGMLYHCLVVGLHCTMVNRV